MMIAFFFLALVCSVAICQSQLRGFRQAIVVSYLVLGVLILVSTEFLSATHGLNRTNVCLVWGGVLSGLAAYAWKSKSWPIPATCCHRCRLETLLLVAITGLVVVLAAVAWSTPPNTWDSMTYHMSRVMHWMQNHTTAFYPTHIDRQLIINPFAEYWITHFMLLSGSDRWANMVQWFSMAGSLVAISLIAAELGLGRLGQILSAFLVITLPNAIVQSTSTQNDFVGTLWMSMAVYFILRHIRTPRWGHVLAISMAVILAFLTKPTNLFILGPFVLWMALEGRWRQALVVGTALACVMGLFFLKNFMMLGHSANPVQHGYVVPWTHLPNMISALILQLTMHLRSGFLGVDQHLGNLVEWLHGRMGMTVMGSPSNILHLPFNYQDFPFFEDQVPNLLFYVGLLIATGYFVICRRKDLLSIKGKFLLTAWFSFVAFGALATWSPFNGRYHLPFFVIFAPVLAGFLELHRKWAGGVTLVMTLLAVVLIVFNGSKPWVEGKFSSRGAAIGPSIFKTNRDVMYFYNRPGAAYPLIMASKALASSGCRNIGLNIGEDTWEYPLWVYLRKASPNPLRIEHVLVANSTQKLSYPLGDFKPCLIVSNQPIPAMTYAGTAYAMAMPNGEYSIYAPVR